MQISKIKKSPIQILICGKSTGIHEKPFQKLTCAWAKSTFPGWITQSQIFEKKPKNPKTPNPLLGKMKNPMSARISLFYENPKKPKHHFLAQTPHLHDAITSSLIDEIGQKTVRCEAQGLLFPTPLLLNVFMHFWRSYCDLHIHIFSTIYV